MTQSKQEVAAQKAKIRAEKLRENLAKRKKQLRGRAVEANLNNSANSQEIESKTGKNSVG